MLVLLESLVVGPGLAREPAVASALFWIAILFAATLVANRTFDRELEDDAIDAILVLRGGRDALYAGTMVAVAVVVAIVAVVAGAIALVLLDLPVALPGHLALVVALGVLALPPVIVLVTLLALRVRARVALVPILSFPILIPQLVACTQGAAAALSGDATAAAGWAATICRKYLCWMAIASTGVRPRSSPK